MAHQFKGLLRLRTEGAGSVNFIRHGLCPFRVFLEGPPRYAGRPLVPG